MKTNVWPVFYQCVLWWWHQHRTIFGKAAWTCMIFRDDTFTLWIISQNVYLWFHWGSSCLLEEWNETISGIAFPGAMVLFEWPPDWMLFLQILYVKLLTCWSKWYELYCSGVGQEITIVCKNMKVCIFGGCVSGLSIPAMIKIFPSSAAFLTWSTSWSVT